MARKCVIHFPAHSRRKIERKCNELSILSFYAFHTPESEISRTKRESDKTLFTFDASHSPAKWQNCGRKSIFTQKYKTSIIQIHNFFLLSSVIRGYTSCMTLWGKGSYTIKSKWKNSKIRYTALHEKKNTYFYWSQTGNFFRVTKRCSDRLDKSFMNSKPHVIQYPSRMNRQLRFLF